MAKLTAIVCVQNQEALLDACLRKLSFCDEVVVVADRCTDRSQEIARRHGAVVIDGIFPLESQRKLAGVEAASSQWILEVEPDELVDAAVAWEIRAAIQMRPVGDWYDLPIDNYVGETLVRNGWAGALGARRGARLFKRGLKAWEPRRLNAPYVLAGAPGGALKGAIRRVVGRDVGGLMERLNRLTGLAAEDLADDGRARGLTSSLLAAAATFLTGYVVRGGFREGRLGFLVAGLSAMFPVLSQMRAVEVIEARKAAVAAEETRAVPPRNVVGLGR
ncbi:glycosyltransferase family 2 protein [Phenylobacterium sp.]|uniref:glycosyltransferase family 2 protein n=1 Tax=Phenylobacterium sp. TaxID=1871053 RepID=UPI0025DE246D|nr:glycosyltransferase family 2 protein [Phenylobacterium sp.]MBX3483145.1 glycosyltransferase family 2 protein [Phenylobacterium sp.]MCW5760303.1 glycosyltransferase family 2 protein [Phenylobacterium sp.]